ncbi:hypothetical protein [Flavobacterium sp. FlaQc-48]|uniref:hypothetical protein n=1 Tax=Flavobacterium sp. FlaQc-48 TaxID=3374181 RepID=UPI00375811AA
MNPLVVIKVAIEKVPVTKYALSVAGIVAVIAIIKSFGINNFQIPLISILIMIGLMVLLFVFSSLTKSSDKTLQFAGYILVYTVVFISCFSSLLLASCIFFGKPKPLDEIVYLKKNDLNTVNDNRTIIKNCIIQSTLNDTLFPLVCTIKGEVKINSNEIIFQPQYGIIKKNPRKKIPGDSLSIKYVRVYLSTFGSEGWIPLNKSNVLEINKTLHASNTVIIPKYRFKMSKNKKIDLSLCWLTFAITVDTPQRIEAYTFIQSSHDIF